MKSEYTWHTLWFSPNDKLDDHVWPYKKKALSVQLYFKKEFFLFFVYVFYSFYCINIKNKF